MKPWLVGVAGPSCSGKTTLARALAAAADGAVIVPMDAYYRDLSGLTAEEQERHNYDEPGALDLALLRDHLRALAAGRGVDIPVYDFATHTRTGETVRVEPARVVILEGLFALSDPIIRGMLNTRVYVAAPDQMCLERRLSRDTRERGRTAEEVRRQYAATVRPMCDLHVAPARRLADLVVDGGQPIEESVAIVMGHMEAARRQAEQRGAGRPASQTRRVALMEELYQRYGRARGPASWPGRLRFLWKKYAWMLVVGGARVMKRALDIVVAGALLVALSPLFLAVGLMIKLTDGGPAFFVQTRVGKWGREFRFPKFRSMVMNAEKLKDALLAQSDLKDSVTFKMKRDPRVTWIGRIIRKFSIDELPQLWCVLKGDMTLVGPRPPVPREVAAYTLADRRRLDVTPGLTCFWQVSGRSDIAFPQQVQLDVQYIESQSLWVDFVVLLKTIPAVLLGKGAY